MRIDAGLATEVRRRGGGGGASRGEGAERLLNEVREALLRDTCTKDGDVALSEDRGRVGLHAVDVDVSVLGREKGRTKSVAESECVGKFESPGCGVRCGSGRFGLADRGNEFLELMTSELGVRDERGEDVDEI